jgi:hypothetical protein
MSDPKDNRFYRQQMPREQLPNALRRHADIIAAHDDPDTATALRWAANEIDRLTRAIKGIAEYCSGDGQPIGAIDRLAAIRNTAEKVVR